MRMKPQPTLDMTYSMVLMEEQQRSTSTIEPSSCALAVHQPNKKEYHKDKGSVKSKDWGSEKKRENCKKTGHTIDGCYYLKGFPPKHPLHGVFPKADNERHKQRERRKHPKVISLSTTPTRKQTKKYQMASS